MRRRGLAMRVAGALLSRGLCRALNKWSDAAGVRRGRQVREAFVRRITFGRHFLYWRERVARHSGAKIECLIMLAHLSGIHARSRMRARLVQWCKIAYRLKAKRRLATELNAARRQVRALHQENGALREAMEALASGEAWRDARDA